MIRTDAQINADAADQRPFSNMSEYEYWADSGQGCYDCIHDNPDQERFCPILSVALLSRWPVEWTRRIVKPHPDSAGFNVVDQCTEFTRRPDNGDDDNPEPPPGPKPPAAELDGQVDMFEIFADQIVEQAQRRTAVTA